MTVFHKDQQVNSAVAGMVAEFCKVTKCNKSKAEAMVKEVLALMPKAPGKPLSAPAATLRAKMLEELDNLREEYPQGFTIKQLAERFQCDHVTASNQLGWIIKNKGGIAVVGKQKQPGKGKPANIFNFTA